MQKKCKICWAIKDISLFKTNWYSLKWLKTYKPECTYCHNLILRNKYKDEIVIIRWQPVMKHTEYKEKLLETRREYRKKNKEHINSLSLNWYHKLSEEEKKRRNKIQNIRIKKKREETRLKLIEEKRKLENRK